MLLSFFVVETSIFFLLNFRYFKWTWFKYILHYVPSGGLCMDGTCWRENLYILYYHFDSFTLMYFNTCHLTTVSFERWDHCLYITIIYSGDDIAMMAVCSTFKHRGWKCASFLCGTPCDFDRFWQRTVNYWFKLSRI